MKKRSPLAQKLLAHIRAEGMLRAGERVGIAVSGGADSVALLRLLLELRSELGIVLAVVHVNHQIRGAESDTDADFVGELAAKNRLELHASSLNVPKIAREGRKTLEEAARGARYRFFSSLLQGKDVSKLDKIATAHTLDDQAETVLMRLLRGAGTRGMAGILPQLDGGEIIRPMLTARRGEIEDYLRSLRQKWREDSSNRNTQHTRNRIRHELLPLLEREFNPQIATLLAENAALARAEEEHWQALLREIMPQVAGNGSLNTESLQKLPLAMQRRVLRSAAAHNGLTLDFGHIEAVRRLTHVAATAKPKCIALPGGQGVLQKSNGAPALVFRQTKGGKRNP